MISFAAFLFAQSGGVTSVLPLCGSANDPRLGRLNPRGIGSLQEWMRASLRPSNRKEPQAELAIFGCDGLSDTSRA